MYVQGGVVRLCGFAIGLGIFWRVQEVSYGQIFVSVPPEEVVPPEDRMPAEATEPPVLVAP